METNVTLSSLQADFKRMLKSMGMWYKYSCNVEEQESRLAFWYKGTNFEYHGCVITTNLSMGIE